MPDWSYRTVLRPLLFSLSPELGRRVALTSLGALGAAPLGRWLIDLLGHMRAEPAPQQGLSQRAAQGPVGLGALIDPHGSACAALSRFGVGFLEVGPVLQQCQTEPVRWARDAHAQTLHCAAAIQVEAAALARRLSARELSAPLWVRIGHGEPRPGQVVDILRRWSAVFLLEIAAGTDDAQLSSRVREVYDAARSDGVEREVLLSAPADLPGLTELARAALSAGCAGIWVRGELTDGAPQADGGRAASKFGSETSAPVRSVVAQLRAALPASAVIVAGGVHAPEDARALRQAGAQLTACDAGLVFSGPGLIKRCNQALELDRADPVPAEPQPLSLRAARSAWFWALMLGLAMVLGGLLAFAIASTRVVLPYDEALCGLTRAQMISVNPRLLPFMAHDRISLAGSMLSIGVLYSALAYHGVRRGAHWAQVTVVVSAFIGFLSMFFFLGFGYFDPFHAFVTGVLFQFVLLCLIGQASEPRPLERPEWRETAAWRRGQWGQLIFVAIAVGIVAAGCVITYVGCSGVFVAEDLDFMRTTAAQLAVAHERLLPLVAHDRASLGGMLIANGVAILLSALWGFRAGAGWLWRALALAGNLAFGSAVGVHFVVGYDSVLHLAPAFLGWALWLLALLLTHGWLVEARGSAPEPGVGDAVTGRVA